MAVFTSEQLGRQGRSMSNDNEPTIPAPHHVWREVSPGVRELLYATGDPIPESKAKELGIKPAKVVSGAADLQPDAKVAVPEGKVAEPGQSKTRAPRKRAAAKPKE